MNIRKSRHRLLKTAAALLVASGALGAPAKAETRAENAVATQLDKGAAKALKVATLAAEKDGLASVKPQFDPRDNSVVIDNGAVLYKVQAGDGPGAYDIRLFDHRNGKPLADISVQESGTAGKPATVSLQPYAPNAKTKPEATDISGTDLAKHYEAMAAKAAEAFADVVGPMPKTPAPKNSFATSFGISF